MNIYLNIHLNIYMNIQITSDLVTRPTHLAWTRKFDENLKQGGVMRMRIEGLRASACFASRR